MIQWLIAGYVDFICSPVYAQDYREYEIWYMAKIVLEWEGMQMENWYYFWELPKLPILEDVLL